MAENYSSAIDLYTAALGIDHLFADFLLQEHMPTSSLISLNKPKKMPTRFEQVMIIYIKGDVFRAFKFYEIGIPAQAPWQKPSFDLGSHPSILEGSGDDFNVHLTFGTI